MTLEQIKANHLARVRATLPALNDFDGAILTRAMVVSTAMQRALGVVTRDPRIRAWLEANDPQALGQALAAMELWAEEHPAVRP